LHLSTQTINQYIYWRHVWRAEYSNGNIAELEAVEYMSGPLRDRAGAYADKYAWVGNVPWAGDVFAFHSRTALYPGHKPMPGRCLALGDGVPCYYDASSSLAESIVRKWITHGQDDAVVWDALRSYDDTPWPAAAGVSA
jgi:hypothetical protein